jgi:sec-independent protein translocase protein TatA
MLSNIGPVQLLIVLVIVLAIFGTKRLRTLGSDLGSAVKGFRSAVSDADKDTSGELGDRSRDADFENTPVDEPVKDKTQDKNKK